MIYRKKEDLPPQVYDAITLSELLGANWDSIYVDSNREIAIRFKGKLTPLQVKTITLHFMDIVLGDTDVTIVKNDSFYSNGITEIYLPDGIKFWCLWPKTVLREYKL